ncbi:uncharacterized protein LOC135848945 [Planococcus citri]|uniref:uncharacterized protein LOC135848945 n=1 Tax=Planococcus citri TaxID=170843 RepID=UPI0031F974D7
MAEITSDVFDIFHPTPVSLRELSAIVISLEIWRCEINKYRSRNTLNEFHPSGELISSKTLIRDLPPIIYHMIDKYVEIFGDSMKDWLWRHHRAVFKFHYNSQNSVLEYFEDFVCDYDGTIDYEKTAERMMQCDQFEVHQKFLIACTYCFKKDILRIWPLRLKKTDSLYRSYSENPQFQYWINFLEYHIRFTYSTILEWMSYKFMPLSRSFLEYFWNIVSSEKRLRIAINLCINDLPSLVRFILPKLDDQQLNEFLHENGCELLYVLLKKSCCDEEVILSTWICVKNMMNEIAFSNLIVKMMQAELRNGYVTSKLHLDGCSWFADSCRDDRRDIDDFVQLCIEIWNTAAKNLKRSAVRDIASNNELFKDRRYLDVSPTPRELKFSLAVLSHATYEQRNAFWYNCWQYLITETWGEGLHKIMRLCLRDEDEITQFKKNVIANDESVLFACSESFNQTYFDEVNDFLRFLLPEEEAARNFKQKILRLAVRNGRFSDSCVTIAKKQKEFDEFIRDAYGNVDPSTDFKNKLLSSTLIQKPSSVGALFVPIEQVIEFMGTFVSTKRILLEVKNRVINFLKKQAAVCIHKLPFAKYSLNSLLWWCFESNEEVPKSELSY